MFIGQPPVYQDLSTRLDWRVKKVIFDNYLPISNIEQLLLEHEWALSQ